ncbi:hypothetical protein [Catellatospora sichuanensis]|uniref:hypothetical protein n=1 Tax=Catellatospora sichuanensis TaxID=1969805 RepID=UPI0011843F5D|nr:hypothetical protein [Catellatospora sichuanensis]
MTDTPDVHLQLALLASRRVRQYQSAANGIAALGFAGTVLLCVAAATVGPPTSGVFDLAGRQAVLLLLASVLCGLSAVGVNAARLWTRFYHAESEGWLDQVVPAAERATVIRQFLAGNPAPTALSVLWTAMLGVTSASTAITALMFLPWTG